MILSRSFASAVLGFGLALGAVALRGADPAPNQGELREITVTSEAVGRNLLGLPAEQRVSVYLPPGYAATADARFPVLYLLHSIGGDSREWTERLEIGALADRLIAERRLPPTILVMPNAMTPYGGSFYVDSPVSGGWDQFISRELVAEIDRRFRTRAAAASRAVAGHSMGGFGAIHLGAAHSDVFGGVYAMSPCCLDLVEDLGHANQEWLETLRLRDAGELRATIQARRFYPTSLIALSMALSPNPSRPPFFADYPVRAEEGALKAADEIARLWRARMPVGEAQAQAEALSRLHTIYLDYGTEEQFAHIPAGALRYSAELGRLGIPHTLAVYRGDHREAVGERLEAFVLPLVAKQFGAASKP